MSWEKYGSPYDPNYRGKMQRPKENGAREHRKSQSRMCWCGDPNCSVGLEGAAPGGGSSMSSNFISPSEFQRMMEETVRISISTGFRPGASAYTETRSGPPSSYSAARNAVEKYLSKAPQQTFDDIIGNDEALGQLRDAIQAPVKHKALYEAYGMKMPKGALLSGPPGCGKTMFARAAASEMERLYGGEVEFISISGSELQSKFIGETEERIKAIFTFAREYKAYRKHPLLVFMDEAEVLLPDRTGRVRRVAPWEESQVATFLAEMDGMHESGAFVLLATNRPEVIDQAVLRDGRCDFKITVKRPTMEAIEVILRRNFDGILIGDDGIAQLVFAAVETLSDPHKIIAEAHAIGLDVEELKVKDLGHKHFLLEHIVSGAMAASVPNRAKRYAFARDKVSGVAKGVTVADVVAAVNDLFEENKALDHSFALDEFKRELMEEVRTRANAESRS
ncbi:AAA family ATPase [Rhizorhabdus wittichii]|uniref:AAA family ATPase n=1 Tax=Rhizorhabdus wittichii TaxID=160791 RepID=A0A975HDH9_9SPHN|nr:AAA family ATPase [Rhizorhabdus wittichii]QTH19754.1 AAA family ATPase [Rhizorhabdus wittichii]